MTNQSIARPIMLATAVAGTLDILFAMILTLTIGKGDLLAMLRVVASGPFPQAADWGVPGAILGLLVHFTLMAIMATIFVLIVRARPVLLETPWRTGVAYGVVTYFVMNWAVVPVRFGAPLPPKPISIVTQAFAHIVLVGTPFALIAARTLRRSFAADPLPA